MNEKVLHMKIYFSLLYSKVGYYNYCAQLDADNDCPQDITWVIMPQLLRAIGCLQLLSKLLRLVWFEGN
jgi:hypothetical protein